MSSSKKPSVQSQIDALEQRIAAQDQRIAALEAAAATAPAAEAPAKGKGKRAAKPKKEKNPDAPKRAPTAFFAFNASERAKSPDEKLTASVLSERWKLLSKEQQDAYKPAATSEAAASASEAE